MDAVSLLQVLKGVRESIAQVEAQLTQLRHVESYHQEELERLTARYCGVRKFKTRPPDRRPMLDSTYPQPWSLFKWHE